MGITNSVSMLPFNQFQERWLHGNFYTLQLPSFLVMYQRYMSHLYEESIMAASISTEVSTPIGHILDFFTCWSEVPQSR